MEATKKVGMISKRIVLVSAIVLLAGSVTAINIEHANPLEKNTSTLSLIGMFFAMFLIYLAGKLFNSNSVTLVRPLANRKREHHHYKKIIKKTA